MGTLFNGYIEWVHLSISRLQRMDPLQLGVGDGGHTRMRTANISSLLLAAALFISRAGGGAWQRMKPWRVPCHNSAIANVGKCRATNKTGR